jgi:glutamyl-tRNA synthetase
LNFWWNIVYGKIKFINHDQQFIQMALKTLPKDSFDTSTWSKWTSLLMKESGKKGKDLFKPLRLCLTGQSNGPEMASLVLIMGRDKVIERLNNKD